jgi:hypothetical protein
MEALLSANEDVLIPPLSLTVGKGASYIQNRRAATIFSSQNSCSPSGVQVCKWNISSATEWADPGSIILSFDVNNLDAAKTLYPATSGAHCLFERYQCRIASTGVEDQEHYGRLVEGFTRLMPSEKKLNEGALGFGTEQQQFAAAANPLTSPAEAGVRRAMEKSLWKSGDHVPKSIPAGSSKKVYMKLPLSGILGPSQTKYLPLWALGAGGIEVSLSLAPAASAVITHPTIHATGALTTAGDGSINYSLTNLRIEVDMISIDSALQEQYSRNMLEGGALTLHTKLWNATQVYLPPANAGSFDVSISKSLSRVATCFQSFSEELTAEQQAQGTMYVNNFRMYPSASESCESHMTVGSKRFPEFENKSITGHFWKLMSALGVSKSLPHTLSTDVDSYAANSFISGTDLEACPLVMSSGIQTTGGQEIAFHARGFVGADPAVVADILRRCWMMLHYEAIVEIRATGAHLLT